MKTIYRAEYELATGVNRMPGYFENREDAERAVSHHGRWIVAPIEVFESMEEYMNSEDPITRHLQADLPSTVRAKYPREVLDNLRDAGEITEQQRERLMTEKAEGSRQD